jgi:hypothetical protein
MPSVKKDHQHALDVQPGVPCFPWAWRGEAFPVRGLLVGFWVITVNPGFISCYDCQEEVSVVSYFSQQFLAHKHMPLLLLIAKQPRQRLCRDMWHDQVLH